MTEFCVCHKQVLGLVAAPKQAGDIMEGATLVLMSPPSPGAVYPLGKSCLTGPQKHGFDSVRRVSTSSNVSGYKTTAFLNKTYHRENICSRSLKTQAGSRLCHSCGKRTEPCVCIGAPNRGASGKQGWEVTSLDWDPHRRT